MMPTGLPRGGAPLHVEDGGYEDDERFSDEDGTHVENIYGGR